MCFCLLSCKDHPILTEEKVLLLKEDCHLIVDTLRSVEELTTPMEDISKDFSSLELKTLVVEYVYETQNKFATQLNMDTEITAAETCMRNQRVALSGSWPLKFHNGEENGSAVNLEAEFFESEDIHLKDMHIQSEEKSELTMTFETYLKSLETRGNIYWVGKHETRYYLVVEEESDSEYNVIWVAIYEDKLQ